MTGYLTEWNVICRVCLQDGEMISVYDKDENNISFCEKIMYCASVNIQSEESLPEFICLPCVEDLNTAYRFRSVCESSDAILQSYSIVEKPTAEDRGAVIVSGENGLYQCKLLPQDIKIKKVTSHNSKNFNNSVVIKTRKQELDEIITDAIEPEEELLIKTIKEEPEQYYEEQLEEITNEEEYLEDEGEYLIENVDVHEDETTISPNLETEIELATAELGTLQSGLYIKSSDFPVDTILDLGNIRLKKEISENGEEYYELTEDVITHTTDDVKNDYTNVAEEVPATKKRGRKRKKSDSDKNARPHMCEICGNTYRFRFNLEAHTRRHTGEKPFCCGTCGKGFVIAFELRRHMRCHNGEKPYQCKFCERKFSDFGSRIKHQRSHTGERPYVCEVCGKTFAYSHVLSSHNLIHTGVKKYSCDACGKRFTKSHHLKAHLNVHLRASPNTKVKTKQEPELVLPD